MSNSFANQTLASSICGRTKDVYKVGVYTLPKKLDEEVARLHLEKIGVKLTRLSEKQAAYLGVPVEGRARRSITATKSKWRDGAPRPSPTRLVSNFRRLATPSEPDRQDRPLP